jgi:hypothetical protein
MELTEGQQFSAKKNGQPFQQQSNNLMPPNNVLSREGSSK